MSDLDGRSRNGSVSDQEKGSDAGNSRPSASASPQTSPRLPPQNQISQQLSSNPPTPPPPQLSPNRDALESDTSDHPSSTSLRSAFMTNVASPGGTVRVVTPDLVDASASSSTVALDTSLAPIPRDLSSQQASPRSVPGGASRRQGMVFNDSFSDPYDSSDSEVMLGRERQVSHNVSRPRTRTMESPMMAQRSAPPMVEGRHRLGSVGGISPSTSQTLSSIQATFGPPAAMIEEQKRSQQSSMGYPSVVSSRADGTTSPGGKHRKSPSRRLLKRQSSRPSSPIVAPPPTLDSLPVPVFTEDANKIILLMKTLCGRMRGEVEYQGESDGPWHKGIAYIDDEKACLMFDCGQDGPFHIPMVTDLRGCRVCPVDISESGQPCLELIAATSPPIEILLRPVSSDETDLWLAALLSWCQMRPIGSRPLNGRSAAGAASLRPDFRRQPKAPNGSKPTNIIKVGKVMLWDKGFATSPRALVRRSSTRDSRSPAMAWRRVSCILQDNGDFKLLMENDVTALSIIVLSQLSRCAIQQLDRTVLDEEHCIAIFPIYASTAQQLSIFRPVYLALDSRVHFEVWLTLLRAFAVPDIYKLMSPENESVEDVTDLGQQHDGEVFRVEKSLNVRVTEAKIKAQPSGHEVKHVKSDMDPIVGNYLAEVILDGEVRARTTLKTATKNPFWRDECEFVDLPPSLPYLSVVLKRVEGNLDSLSNQLQASLGLPKTGNLQELTWGSVDASLEQVGQGRDTEQWLQITDDKKQTLGSMLIRIAHDEQIILLEKDYKDLSAALHRFTTGLTTLVATAMPSQLRRLAECFLNIFQVSGKASDWLMALVEDEIDGIGSQATIKKFRFSSRLKSNESIESSSDRELIVRDMGKSLAGEANLLFRGNSLLTQSLEFHMRRLGKEYLEDVLQDKIFDINEINPDCEVDPSKVGNNGLELEQRWSQLIHLTTEIWLCIADSATKIPPELRHVLKYVRAVAEDRYGDFLRTVAYTSVSGFLFLRFICPAILSPKLFGLLRDHPRPRAQRTLTLIAKALQKMANLSNFGKREEWMEPMNRFLNVQRTSFRDYIDQVCAIPADRNTALSPASYSTPITIMGRLGSTAKEGFPSLPYLIDPTRSFAGLVKLWTDANPLETKKDMRDGELLKFNEICWTLRRRTDACQVKLDFFRAAEASGSGADDLAETLEQASMIESLNLSYGGSAANWVGLDRNAPGSSGSDAADEMTVNPRRTSREVRRGRDGMSSSWDSRKVSGLRNVSGNTSAPGTVKSKNGKVGRTILSGIMRIGGRGESPEPRREQAGKK